MADRTLQPATLRRCIEIGIVVILYFGAARLGLSMALTNKNVSPVWPPSGVALAVLLLVGARVWPAIWLGAFLANYSTGLSFLTAFAIGAGNTLEAAVGATLLQRMGFQYRQITLRDILGFILFAGILSPAFAATPGVTVLLLNGYIRQSAWAQAWWTWWLGDGMGILVVAPVLLAWATPFTSLDSWRELSHRSWKEAVKSWRIVEACALLLSLAAVTRFIFGSGQEYPYVVFPCLIWAAMRFGLRGATTAVLVVSGLAVWGTLQHLGPFVKGTPERSLEFLQTFMGVVSITTLVMAAAMTERERGEQRQAQLLAEVQRQRQRLDAILTTVPATVWEAYGQPDSATQRIGFVSGYVRTMVGYDVEEWLSEPNFWLKIVHPEDQEQAASRATEAFDSGKAHSNRFRWLAKDGHVLWTEAHSVAIRDSDGRPIGMRGVNIDITEHKYAEDERERLVLQLQQHQHEIEELNERLRRSMAETHHRIKNNLQVICALIELQEMKGLEMIATSELRELRQHVQSLSTIHDLLTSQAKRNGSADSVSLKEAMQKLAPLLQGMVGDRRLDFAVDDASVLVRQATALAILANELVSNALKHGAGDITVTLVVAEPTAVLEVCDSGQGFPHGFDPQKFSSTGMELIYSLSTWDLGGQVAFENRSQGGARVAVTFPVDLKSDEYASAPPFPAATKGL